MYRLFTAITAVVALALVVIVTLTLNDLPVLAQHALPVPPVPPQSAWVQHRVVIQVDQADPTAMNLALNNAANMKDYWDQKGETSTIEFVAFGPGLAMVRSESPVRERITELTKKGIVFTGCGTTKAKAAKAENKEITFLDGVSETPTGVGRIVELEEAGWTYLRP